MIDPIQYDDCLSIRGRYLYIEDCNTIDLVKEFGSPLFVISEAQLRNNIRRFQQSFKQGWDADVMIMPAAKANWVSAIQRIIADEGCGCDIYSPGEFDVAMRSGFQAQHISVNGVPKDPNLIRMAIAKGARITIDSLEEMPMIQQSAAELNKTAVVRLRIKPTLSGFNKHSDFSPGGLIATDLAALAYKGGLPIQDVIRLGREILKMNNVRLIGFHQHHGRHHRSLAYWKEQMKTFAQDLGRVRTALDGFQPREIDIGGGFASRRDPFNAETHYAEPFEMLALHLLSKSLKILGSKVRYKVLNYIIDKSMIYHPNQVMAPTIEDYAQICTTTLKKQLPKNGIDLKGLSLQLEPGRSLHGDTGIHLTTLKSIKSTTAPLKWKHLIFDTTEFWFTGGRLEHHLHEYIFANKANVPRQEKADIVGRSCYGDRLIPTIQVPRDAQPGDILALLDVGAYQEPSMSNFNAMPRPGTVLVTDNRASVIRKAETIEDVFRRDVIPQHLR